MAYSFTFNSVNMGDYGLVIREHTKPFAQVTNSSQLRDRAYAFDSLRPEATMIFEVWVTAVDNATLLSYLDSIKAALNRRGDGILRLDLYDDRYWLARFESMSGGLRGRTAWEGTVTFILHDPVAYDNDLTTSPFTINDDPEECPETVGGTEQTFPVYTLVCNAPLADTDVIVTNVVTGEAITWEGSLVSTDILEIDTVNYLVKLNGVVDMITVNGQFPRLLVGGNLIIVEGFSGSMNIVYRERYV